MIQPRGSRRYTSEKSPKINTRKSTSINLAHNFLRLISRLLSGVQCDCGSAELLPNIYLPTLKGPLQTGIYYRHSASSGTDTLQKNGTRNEVDRGQAKDGFTFLRKNMGFGQNFRRLGVTFVRVMLSFFINTNTL